MHLFFCIWLSAPAQFSAWLSTAWLSAARLSAAQLSAARLSIWLSEASQSDYIVSLSYLMAIFSANLFRLFFLDAIYATIYWNCFKILSVNFLPWQLIWIQARMVSKNWRIQNIGLIEIRLNIDFSRHKKQSVFDSNCIYIFKAYLLLPTHSLLCFGYGLAIK